MVFPGGAPSRCAPRTAELLVFITRALLIPVESDYYRFHRIYQDTMLNVNVKTVVAAFNQKAQVGVIVFVWTFV